MFKKLCLNTSILEVPQDKQEPKATWNICSCYRTEPGSIEIAELVVKIEKITGYCVDSSKKHKK